MQGKATIVTDSYGFTGVELRFPYAATHPKDDTLLREWIATLPGARWNKKGRAWVVPEINDVPRGALTAAGFDVQFPDGRPARPRDLATTPPRPPLPVPDHLEIPDWFELPLYPYQATGAIDVAAGRRLLADAPGVGKTRTALAAAAILRSRRTLVVCPPVVVTHWARETVASRLGPASSGEVSGSVSGAPYPGDLVPPESTARNDAPDTSSVITPFVVAIAPGKKVPDLPPSGVVIVGATLIAARPALTAMLREWQPTVFICDEAHLAKSWGSLRSRVLRRIARSAAVTIPTTGTPVLANPIELAPLLDLAGVLDPLYGSFLDFRSRFARKSKWGYAPKKDRLPELREILDTRVWVRRTKDQVLSELPPKSRRTLWVDVDDSEYQAALDDVIAQIEEWIDAVVDETGDMPSQDDVAEWVETQGGMVVQLRQAAGLAKTPAAAAWIVEWLEGSGTSGALDSPLVVWVHHHCVTEALLEHLSGHSLPGDGVAVIAGGVSDANRVDIVDRFQQGRIPVLICSIHAAGMGITLTRASEALFVETDWTPAMIVQAEDRLHRIGQKSAVSYTTMVAAGTLDERVHAVLLGKAGILGSLMDGDHAVYTKISERVLSRDLLSAMVQGRIRKRAIARRKAGAAA